MPHFRMMAYCAYIFSALFGLAAGTLGFVYVQDWTRNSGALARIPGMYWVYTWPEHDKFSGSLVSHDRQGKRLVINIPNSFPASDAAVQPMEFSYDEETQWFSVEYVFEDDVLQKRHFIPERPRDLPEGTLMSIVQRRDGNGLRATGIAFLRRTSI